MYLKLLLSFGLVMIPSGKVLAQETQTTTKHIYPQDFVSDYLAECQQRAIAEDLLPEDAEIICNCTINSFQNKYSFEEYQQLSQETKEEVGYDCFDQLLYEDEGSKFPPHPTQVGLFHSRYYDIYVKIEANCYSQGF